MATFISYYWSKKPISCARLEGVSCTLTPWKNLIFLKLMEKLSRTPISSNLANKKKLSSHLFLWIISGSTNESDTEELCKKYYVTHKKKVPVKSFVLPSLLCRKQEKHWFPRRWLYGDMANSLVLIMLLPQRQSNRNTKHTSVYCLPVLWTRVIHY